MIDNIYFFNQKMAKINFLTIYRPFVELESQNDLVSNPEQDLEQEEYSSHDTDLTEHSNQKESAFKTNLESEYEIEEIKII